MKMYATDELAKLSRPERINIVLAFFADPNSPDEDGVFQRYVNALGVDILGVYRDGGHIAVRDTIKLEIDPRSS